MPHFANNLTRSPASSQAPLALQDLSDCRYEAALGAGWAQGEVVGMGPLRTSHGSSTAANLHAGVAIRRLTLISLVPGSYTGLAPHLLK